MSATPKPSGLARSQYLATARRLRKLLRDNEWKQKDLAVLCGKTKGAISHWVSGHSRPRIEDLRIIAEHFDVTVDWLLGRDV